jgi:hypothetical protein
VCWRENVARLKYECNFSAGLRGGMIVDSSPGRGWDLSFRHRVHTFQSPLQWIPRAFSLWVKRPGRESDHSPPSSAEVKNARSCAYTPPIRLHGVVLI